MDPTKSGFKTSEFWTNLAALAASIITLLVLFGYVKPQDQESLTKAISSVIAAVGALMVQWGVARGYGGDRKEIKVAAIKQGLAVESPKPILPPGTTCRA